jgi:CyaY protein
MPQAVRPGPHSSRNTIYKARSFMREMLARDPMTQIESSEAEFNLAANATLAHIEQALEAADLDFETPADGILEVEFEDGSKIIINRHGVAREIWVAARSGGFHFKPQNGDWVDTKDGTPLYAKLAALVAAQGGGSIRF